MEYCNCEHAQMLRQALESAESAMLDGAPDSGEPAAFNYITQALRRDEAARLEYELDAP